MNEKHRLKAVKFNDTTPHTISLMDKCICWVTMNIFA